MSGAADLRLKAGARLLKAARDFARAAHAEIETWDESNELEAAALNFYACELAVKSSRSRGN